MEDRDSKVYPIPYGKMTPSLLGSYNYNIEGGYLSTITCPAYGSENVCCLDSKFNPKLNYSGRWFCISCQESWEYEYCEEPPY